MPLGDKSPVRVRGIGQQGDHYITLEYIMDWLRNQYTMARDANAELLLEFLDVDGVEVMRLRQVVP